MLLFTESFDHYADSTSWPLRKWSASRNAGGSNFIAEGSGRFGNGFSLNERWAYVNLPSNYVTLIAGMAVRCDTTDTRPIFSFWDGGTCHLDVSIVASTGNVRLHRGPIASGTQLATAVIPSFSQFTYFYYELRATISDTVGEYELRVNGVPLIGPTTGADTRNGASAQVNRFRIGSSADEFATWYFDDIYICDDTDSGIVGAPNDDFLGDVRIEVIRPNANGTTSDFDGSDGNSVDNYLHVDDTNPDDDTTYVQTTVLNEKDTYNYGSLATTTGFVYGAIAYLAARKTDAGTRSVRAVCRSNTTEDEGPDIALSTSFNYFPTIYEADPDTGGAWDIAGINAAEFGMKVSI